MQLDSKWSVEQEVGFDFIPILQIVFALANLVKWSSRLSTFDRLAEIREVDVVHTLGSWQPGEQVAEEDKVETISRQCGERTLGSDDLSPAGGVAHKESAEQVATSTRQFGHHL